jgi:hypothetical protein
MKRRITVYIDHLDDNTDYLSMKAWIEKWKSELHIEDYSSGGYEHCWDFEVPEAAVLELPSEWLCASDWAGIE